MLIGIGKVYGRISTQIEDIDDKCAKIEELNEKYLKCSAELSSIKTDYNNITQRIDGLYGTLKLPSAQKYEADDSCNIRTTFL